MSTHQQEHTDQNIWSQHTMSKGLWHI